MATSKAKYPKVKVKAHEDHRMTASAVIKVLREQGEDESTVVEFYQRASSLDQEAALAECRKWVTVEEPAK